MANERERAIEDAKKFAMENRREHFTVAEMMAAFHLSRLAADRTGAVREFIGRVRKEIEYANTLTVATFLEWMDAVLAEMEQEAKDDGE